MLHHPPQEYAVRPLPTHSLFYQKLITKQPRRRQLLPRPRRYRTSLPHRNTRVIQEGRCRRGGEGRGQG